MTPPRTSFTYPLSQLREMVQEAKDLSKVFVYFDDHLGKFDNFHRLGSEEPHRALVGLIRGVVRAGLHVELKDKALLRHLPAHHFWHGTLLGNGSVAVLFYFSDLDRGVCALQQFGVHRTEFLRYSLEGRTHIEPDSVSVSSWASRSSSGIVS